MNATDQAANASGGQPPKLLDRVAVKMRLLHYSKRTERAYVDWINGYPREMGAAEIEAFLEIVASIPGGRTATLRFSALPWPSA
jgi:hypothetical protein